MKGCLLLKDSTACGNGDLFIQAVISKYGKTAQ